MVPSKSKIIIKQMLSDKKIFMKITTFKLPACVYIYYITHIYIIVNQDTGFVYLMIYNTHKKTQGSEKTCPGHCKTVLNQCSPMDISTDCIHCS